MAKVNILFGIGRCCSFYTLWILVVGPYPLVHVLLKARMAPAKPYNMSLPNAQWFALVCFSDSFGGTHATRRNDLWREADAVHNV